MKLQLNDFDKIIFDMDGVITNELAYWQTAAVSLYDLLFSYEHYGKSGTDREWCRRQYREIYNNIFCGGRTVKAVKNLGVNTNWDLLYVVFCVSKYLDFELDTPDNAHFQSVCMFIENIDMKAPEVYDALSQLVATAYPEYPKEHFKRGGDGIWKEMIEVFQLWFHGCDEFEGVKTEDRLLFEVSDLKRVLGKLKDRGIKLGIGTGRPRNEIEYPLSQTGLDEYFDKDMYVCFDEVCEAEEELKPKLPLAKPDPFVFLKAVLGKTRSNKEIHEGEYTYDEIDRVLVVGDAPSDLMSAKRGGFSFLGVTTGALGEKSREYFEENEADYILDSILELEELC